jgi:hypothetical protein
MVFGNIYFKEGTMLKKKFKLILTPVMAFTIFLGSLSPVAAAEVPTLLGDSDDDYADDDGDDYYDDDYDYYKYYFDWDDDDYWDDDDDDYYYDDVTPADMTGVTLDKTSATEYVQDDYYSSAVF